MRAHFKVFRTLSLRGPRWYWHLRAENGEVLAHSEAYTRKASAYQGIEAVKRLAADAPVEE